LVPLGVKVKEKSAWFNPAWQPQAELGAGNTPTSRVTIGKSFGFEAATRNVPSN